MKKDIKNKLGYKIGKRIVIFATSVGASTIVYKLLKGRVTPSNVIQKVTVPLGVTAIAGVVSGVAAKQMNEDIDSVADYVSEVINDLDRDR